MGCAASKADEPEFLPGAKDMNSATERTLFIHAQWVTMSKSLLVRGATSIAEKAAKAESLQTAKMWDNLRFERLCEQGQIAWLKVGFLRGHRRQSRGWLGTWLEHGQCLPLPRRQDLPEEALVVGAPNPAVNHWVVSHPWLAEQHPDIDGDQLTELMDKLDDHGAQDEDVVFLDYHSLFQAGYTGDDRTPDQYRYFKASLKAINMVYTSNNCKVIVLAEIPKSALQPDEVVKRDFIPDGEVMLTRNATPFHERGWCWFELLISVMFKTCVTLDEGAHTTLTDLLVDLFASGTWGDDPQAHAKECIPWLWAKSESIPPVQVFQERIAQGDISFIKVSYLRALAQHNSPWPEWENIPDACKWSGDPAQMGDKLDGVKVYTVSYAWNSDRDPERVLAKYNIDLVDRLEMRGALDIDLVFVTRMSIPCRPTTDAQKERCQRAEEVFYWLFSSPRFRVIIIWRTPKSIVSYHQRGRCIFELLVSVFSGTLVLDEEAVRVFVITKLFLNSLRTKHFTRGATDLKLVGALLERLVLERNGLGRLAYETNAAIADYQVDRQLALACENLSEQKPPPEEEPPCESLSGFSCFPSSARVIVRGRKEPVLVPQLRLGDEVLVRGGRYEPVMLFVHRDEGLESRVRVLATSDGSTLKLTPDHVVPLANGQRLAARYVSVGDALFSATGRRVAVESAAYAPATGELHFKTPSGEVCVDGILCCTYNDESATLRNKQQQKKRKSVASLELRGRRWLYMSLSLAWRVSKPLGLVASHLVQTVMSWRYPTDIIF